MYESVWDMLIPLKSWIRPNFANGGLSFFWELKLLSYYVIDFISDILVAANQGEVIYLLKQVYFFSFKDSCIECLIMGCCLEVKLW